MSEPKPFASLGPTLLARKGGARPAMRPQFGAQFSLERSEEDHEDLGWNDMDGHHLADVLPLMPANEGAAEVHRQQDFIATRIAQPAPFKRAPATQRKSALDDGRRAAFTLRVDAERHLKLRLACTIRNRSAQQLVTEALDQLLAEMPDLDSLAAQMQRK
jgi:hypothetical protein